MPVDANLLKSPERDKEGVSRAFQALQYAADKGWIKGQELLDAAMVRPAQRSAARQQAAEDIQASQNRMELAPQVQDLNRQQLIGEADILPLRQELEQRQLQAAVVGGEITPAQQDFMESFKKLGRVDLAYDDNGMIKSLPELVKAHRDAAASGGAGDSQKEFVDVLKKSGNLDLAYNEDGSLKSTPELAEALRKSRESDLKVKNKQLTSNQTEKLINAVDNTENSLVQLKSLKKYLFELDKNGNIVRDEQGKPMPSATNPVGPAAGSGIGRAATATGAFFGLEGSTKKAAAQDAITQAVNNLALNKVTMMKGNLSDRDVKFLLASVPRLASQEITWDEFLRIAVPRMEESIKRSQALLRGEDYTPPADLPKLPDWEELKGLDEEAKPEDVASAEAGQKGPTGSPGNPRVPAGYTLVTSAEQYASLDPGTKVVDAQGNRGTKP